MLRNYQKIPQSPGVYYMKDGRGKVIYIGKATNLKNRVSSYFTKAHDQRIEHLVAEIKKIDFKITPSVLEALILEANEIRRLKPKYNIRERDDKSYLYLVFTKDKFPRPELVRGHELKRFGARRFQAIYGPYTSAASIRAALSILRKIFPYSTCESPSPYPLPSRERERERGSRWPCFYYHLKLCPGVCIGAVDLKTYKKIIRQLGLVFAGKKKRVLKEFEREMKQAAKEERFEEAAKLRSKIFALEHIQDVAILTHTPSTSPSLEGEKKDSLINIFGRIEGYDISNISGVESVGSMVVFEAGEPKKSEYRHFKIKSIRGINDVAMIREVVQRRFFRIRNKELGIMGWTKPDLILIDGGWGQVNAVQDVIKDLRLKIKVIGIAKGFKRKQDRPIYEKNDPELARIAEQYKDLLLRVRDEAHRFALKLHRQRMRKRMLH